MVENITWDTVVVWLLFLPALYFIFRPLLPKPKKKTSANAKADGPSCTKCHQ